MCLTDHHDMTLAVKVALKPNPINQSIKHTCMHVQEKVNYSGNKHFLLFLKHFYTIRDHVFGFKQNFLLIQIIWMLLFGLVSIYM